tara:strand:+ start:3645 stop:4340 length:696 start_codon:yes stop_codon:yes gene_type:complete
MVVNQESHRPKKNNDFTQFYKKLDAFVPELKKFMTGSLKAAENQAQLDKGFYTADEMLDEVYLKAFKTLSTEQDEKKLRRWLFKLAIQKLKEKKALEVPDDVNTHALLKAELKTLSEEFTTDGDGDRILYEELDDISYQQKQGWSVEIYLGSNLEKQLIDKFNLNEASLLSDEKRRQLGIMYSTIPQRSKTVVELLVFGNQDVHEISKIIDVPDEIIEKILFKVKERFSLL